ncbi:MAG: hypothetical protein DCE90_12325 [Pseudanabaena sp.]|nr:MAG: hypothetical protein DCE90_12325 [Pseudanabaena sp.]
MTKKNLSSLAVYLFALIVLPIEYSLTTGKADAFSLTFAQDATPAPNTGGAVPTTTAAIALRNSVQALSTVEKPFTTLDFQGVATFTAGVYTFGNGTITVNPASATTGGAPANGISGDSGNAAFGFNTSGATYGGAGNNLVRIAGGGANVVLTINFTNPVIDFGFFVTDYGNANVNNNIDVRLFNGSTTLFTALDAGTNPNPLDGNDVRIARFNQFTAATGDSRITSVTITAIGNGGVDRFGIDDIVYSVPFDFEPSLGLGLLGLGFGLNKLRKNLKAKKNTEV